MLCAQESLVLLCVAAFHAGESRWGTAAKLLHASSVFLHVRSDQQVPLMGALEMQMRLENAEV